MDIEKKARQEYPDSTSADQRVIQETFAINGPRLGDARRRGVCCSPASARGSAGSPEPLTRLAYSP